MVHTLQNLKGFERLFNVRILERNLVSKAIQLGYLQKNLNQNALKTSANYKNVYNGIIRTHFSNQQKLNMLRAIEHETNAERIKLALNSVDKNLLNRNAAYNNAYNRVLNKHGMNRVRTRVQQGGTCWFHSIVNGLLMSPRPRRLLKQMTAHVPAGSPMNACPTKSASREWFLRYIKHRLEGPGNVNNVFKNVNVIRSAGLRGLGRPGSARYSLMSVFNSVAGGDASGGTIGDFKWFYKKMFPESVFIIKKFKGSAGRFTGRSNPEVPHFMTKNGLAYELTHAFIYFWIKPASGHAITGYKTVTGNFVAYDSGFGKRVPDYDWTKPAQIAGPSLMWEKRAGRRTGNMNIYAVYMISPHPNHRVGSFRIE